MVSEPSAGTVMFPVIVTVSSPSKEAVTPDTEEPISAQERLPGSNRIVAVKERAASVFSVFVNTSVGMKEMAVWLMIGVL